MKKLYDLKLLFIHFKYIFFLIKFVYLLILFMIFNLIIVYSLFFPFKQFNFQQQFPHSHFHYLKYYIFIFFQVF